MPLSNAALQVAALCWDERGRQPARLDELRHLLAPDDLSYLTTHRPEPHTVYAVLAGADAAMASGQLQQVHDLGSKALEVLAPHGHANGLASAHAILAVAQLEQGAHDTAADHLDAARGLHTEQEPLDPLIRAQVELYRGLACRRRGLRLEAMECYQLGLAHVAGREDAKSLQARSTFHNNVGKVLMLEGRPAEAVPCFERALALPKGEGQARATAVQAGNLAEALSQLDRPDDALRALERAQGIADADGGAYGLAQLHTIRARVLLRCGRAEDALAACAAARSQDIPGAYLQLQMLRVHAQVLAAQEAPEALEVWTELHERSSGLETLEFRHDSAEGLAAAHALQGDWRLAHHWSQRTLALQRERYRQDQLREREEHQVRHQLEQRALETELLHARTTDLQRAVSARTTELEEANRSLQLARDEALAASRAKSTFLSVVSHEFRTPLNAIQGYGEMLQDELLDDAIDRDALGDGLARILTASAHLTGLIEQVLTLSNLANPTQDAVRQDPVDLSLMVPAVVDTIHDPSRHPHQLEVHLLEGPKPLVVHTDRERVETVLRHLLDNALTHTDGGTVQVEVSHHAAGCSIAVRDEGDGLSDADRIRVLEPFQQVDMSYTRTQDGLGVGLALADRHMRALGGRLSLDGAPGGGLEVRMHLPLRRPEPPSDGS